VFAVRRTQGMHRRHEGAKLRNLPFASAVPGLRLGYRKRVAAFTSGSSVRTQPWVIQASVLLKIRR